MRMRDESGHQAMLRCGKEWKRVKTDQTRLWSDGTLERGPALMKARAEAMSIAETNRPIGRGYNTAMAGLLEEYDVNDMSETARAHILKVMENLAAVEEWRVNQPDPDDPNQHPRVWQKVYRSSTQTDAATHQKRAQRGSGPQAFAAHQPQTAHDAD